MLESVKARCFVYSGLHCYIEFWALILAVRSRCLTSIHVFTRHCGNLNRINRLPLYLFLHLIFWFIFEIGLQFFSFFTLFYIRIIKFLFLAFSNRTLLFIFICLFLHSRMFYKLSTIVSYFLHSKHVFFRHFSFHYDYFFIAAILFCSKVTKNMKIISFYARGENFFSFDALPGIDKIREKREYTSLENQFIRRQILYIIASPIFIFPTSVWSAK